MVASSGRGAWISHFRGQGDLPTRIKKSSIIVFDQDGNKLNVSLTQGTDVTYDDNLSQSHPKDSLGSGDSVKKVVAIRVGDQTYFVSVDDIVKPVSLSKINMQPQSFGLGAPMLITNYISSVKSSIKSRQDIKGELEDYLIDLVNYVANGDGITGHNISSSPLKEQIPTITKEFGEVLGPIYCIKTGLINLNLGVNLSSKISFPPAGTKLFDYFIDKIKVSAKADKVNPNTLKMSSLVPTIQQDKSSFVSAQDEEAYDLMETIHNFSMNAGPIEYCGKKSDIKDVSPQAAASVRGLKGNNALISDQSKELFKELINSEPKLKDNKNITLRMISFGCEKRVVDKSKKLSNGLTAIVKKVLNSEVFYVKMSIDSGVPKFNTVSTTDRNFSNIFLRNKNDSGSASDKLGFKV